MTATSLSTGRKQFLHSLFTTAIEGGIGYWSEVEKYRWSSRQEPGQRDDIDGFYATIVSSEEDWGTDRAFQSTVPDPEADGVSVIDGGFLIPLDDEQPLRIDLAAMARGTRMFVAHARGEIDSSGAPVPEQQQQPLPAGHYWRQFLDAEATHGEDGDFDADVADTVVQFGLFGQVLYG